MKYLTNDKNPIQSYRRLVQYFFVALCIWIGVEFYLFVRFLASDGVIAFHQRPPGVEGFLPISSLMSVLYFFKTGQVQEYHPAGFFIFVAIVIMSLVFAKSFCSWLCPVGFISELIATLRKRLKIKKIIVVKWLDYLLRSIKYLLFGFLLFVVSSMTTIALANFLYGGYNIVCDIRMWDFFANLSMVSVLVIVVLMIASFFIESFWCRYLCPYGALLGITGLLSPVKVKRNDTTCIDCNKCTKVCPSNIQVSKLNYIVSDECTSCAQCIDVCPVQDTLQFKVIGTGNAINKKLIAYIVVGIFITITGLAMITSHWQNSISKETYLQYYKVRETFKHH